MTVEVLDWWADHHAHCLSHDAVCDVERLVLAMLDAMRGAA